MTNPYSNIKIEYSEDDWDRILGKYVDEELSPEEGLKIWNDTLWKLNEIESGNSLHLAHAVYLHEGVRYVCYWILSDSSADPCGVAIQTRRPRMNKFPTEQLELFNE